MSAGSCQPAHGSSGSWVVLTVACAVIPLLALGCRPTTEAPVESIASPEPSGETVPGQTTTQPWFVDVAPATSIDFVHTDGRSGRRYYVETAASAGGWLDFDSDGDLDLYLVDGAATPGSSPEVVGSNRLYENLGDRFRDATGASGLGDGGYGMGFCVGDLEGDGDPDVYVTNYGPNRLFRRRDGTPRFDEIADAAGVAGDQWSTGCVFADVDGDRDLDLYVANYLDFDFDRNPLCGDPARGLASYCRPWIFDGQEDALYLNEGVGDDGTVRFVEVAGERGIARGAADRGFGVLASDLDDDGDTDLLVANDGSMNRLYVNDGTGHFEDRSLLSGLALDRQGKAESGMGLDLGDVDGDARLDLVVTNYTFESNTLYLQRGPLFFEDRTVELGLAEPSHLPVGWGVQFLDFDNDGDLDLAVANGHVIDNIADIESLASYPQPNQLFENLGDGRMVEVSAQAGPDFQGAEVSRGLAVGDWNDDGRLDLVVTNTNGAPRLLENRRETDHHWVGLRLVGPSWQPLALGSRVVLLREGAAVAVREVRSGGSLMSQADLRVHFGLGPSAEPVAVEVVWPDGTRQREHLPWIDAYQELRYNPLAASPTHLPRGNP